MILAKRIGEMHCPNKYYLEYVPEAILRDSITYLTNARYKPIFSDMVAARTAVPSKRRPMYLSHFATTKMFAQVVSSLFSSSSALQST